MSTDLAPETRSDGRGYIDDHDLGLTRDEARSPTPSGSSVSEETDESGPPGFHSSLHDELLAKRPVIEIEHSDIDESEVADLALDEEDWGLAPGEFTKQYNRMRQTREVMQASGSRPLPARNVAPSQNAERGPSRQLKSAVSSTGVSTNPKASQTRVKDRSDRATTEQVLDRRTKETLRALKSRGVIGTITSCIGTGKEVSSDAFLSLKIQANVYHSLRADSPPNPYHGALAVKIYSTSKLAFRDRQAYMQGEQRFRNEYTSSRNPRKMVKLWAEKELRNLRRLERVHIRSPRALECKENVLVLEFLGEDMRASPRLKNANIEPDDLPRLYAELLVTIRRIFQFGKLVHADLSEFNILYHRSHLYIIDVSQAVEHDHPLAFEFLRSDLQNIEDHFSKRSSGSVRTLGLKRSWEFVTSDLKAETEEELLEIVHDLMEHAVSVDEEDTAFLHTFIPRALAEIRDPEKVISLGGLEADSLPRRLLAEVDESHEGSLRIPDAETPGKLLDARDENAGEDSDCGSEETGKPTPQNRGFRHEDREDKKARKQAVKEENREKRKHKLPKAQKQKLVKKTAR